MQQRELQGGLRPITAGGCVREEQHSMVERTARELPLSLLNPLLCAPATCHHPAAFNDRVVQVPQVHHQRNLCGQVCADDTASWGATGGAGGAAHCVQATAENVSCLYLCVTHCCGMEAAESSHQKLPGACAAATLGSPVLECLTWKLV